LEFDPTVQDLEPYRWDFCRPKRWQSLPESEKN
jgi:hypothetical protein